jgi:hypothetical protein
MTRLTIAAAFALALSAAGAAHAAERLVLEPYPGEPAWTKVTDQRQGQAFLWELIPSDQKIEAYRDILTAQGFPGGQNRDPATFLKGVFSRTAGACTGVRVNGPREATEDGRKVAYAQVFCARQTGRDFGVNMFFKAIQGAEGLYVVQREFRVPPSQTGGVQSFSGEQAQAMMALIKDQSVANHYLVEAVYLCADASTDPRCTGK